MIKFVSLPARSCRSPHRPTMPMPPGAPIRRTQSCNVCGVQPIFAEIETTAAQRDAWSPSCS